MPQMPMKTGGGRRDWIQRAAYPDHPYSAVVKKTSVYGLIWNEDGLKNFLNSIINLKPYTVWVC